MQLHVCGDTFHFGDGPDSGTSPDASYIAGSSYSYSWSSSGLDWSGHATRRVYLSKGDTQAPVLTDVIVDVDTLTMIYDEELKRTDPVPTAGQINPYTRRRRPAAARSRSPDIRAGVGPNANQVTMTLDPVRRGRADDRGCLFRVNHATAASKAQDLAGNAAAGFNRTSDLNPPVTVRNITLAGPGAKSVAFAGRRADLRHRRRHRRGRHLQRVRDRDRDLDREAPHCAGDRLGDRLGGLEDRPGRRAVHRFEYTVAEGDLDTDGVAVKRNSLETPTGSSIVTTDDSEEVSLGHRLRQDPARPVDGVRPTAMSARSEGPSVSVEWSEALNPGAIPSGAGGFSVDVPGASNPTVTAIAVVGNVVTLSLNAPIALGQRV